jgi:hypothetical protein
MPERYARETAGRERGARECADLVNREPPACEGGVLGDEEH